MNRRSFLASLAALPWSGAGAGATAPPRAHVFGRLPAPGRVKRVFAAGPPAAVLAHVLSPDKLLPPLPDYIYILNILYQMGRQPRLDYIQCERRRAAAPDLDTLVRQVAFSLGAPSAIEKERLAAWYLAAPERARLVDTPRCWAFISWETRAS